MTKLTKQERAALGAALIEQIGSMPAFPETMRLANTAFSAGIAFERARIVKQLRELSKTHDDYVVKMAFKIRAYLIERGQ